MRYIPKHFYKTPAAILGYEWDWTRWLAKRGDTIASVEVTASGLVVSEVIHTNGIVTATLAGGVLGQKYTVTCKITTAGLWGTRVLVNDRSIILFIKSM